MWALVTTSAAILLTSDIPSAILTTLIRRLPTYPVALSNQILAVVLTRPIPLVLLAMSIFYAWVSVREPSALAAAIESLAS